MAFNFQKRLNQEAKGMKASPPVNCSGGPVDPNNLLHWEAYIEGPSGSPYEGGRFKLDIQFPNTYPFQPPTIRFKTKVYHPNINSDGEICLDILKSQWSPALKIAKVLLSICSLLDDPNPDDPLVTEAANLYKNNKADYDKKAKEWTERYASNGVVKPKPKSTEAVNNSQSATNQAADLQALANLIADDISDDDKMPELKEEEGDKPSLKLSGSFDTKKKKIVIEEPEEEDLRDSDDEDEPSTE